MDARDGSDSRTNGLGLNWDYRRYLWGKRFQLVHNAETIIPNDSNVDYLVDAELGLRYLLNSWASLSLMTEWDYISSSDEKSQNERRDRKSTRLNSSHVRISYAVFCLKKKTN